MSALGLNKVELVGDLATDPEIKVFDSGTSLARLLLTVRVDEPRRRVDVVPVTIWEPTEDVSQMKRGDRVSIIGSIQRRYWDQADGRRSRMEVVANELAWFAEAGIKTAVSEDILEDVAEEQGR